MRAMNNLAKVVFAIGSRVLPGVALLFLVSCGSDESSGGAGPGTGGAGGSAQTGGAAGSGAEGGTGGSAGRGDSGLADSSSSDARLYVDGDVQITLPPVDPAKRANELSQGELAALCDWMANVLGGYDMETQCGSGISVRTHKDQAECMRIVFPAGCAITVAEFETCIVAQVPSRGCVFPSSACRALINC